MRSLVLAAAVIAMIAACGSGPSEPLATIHGTSERARDYLGRASVGVLVHAALTVMMVVAG